MKTRFATTLSGVICLLLFMNSLCQSNNLPNFTSSQYFPEQIRSFTYPSDVTITIVAPCADSLRSDRLTSIILFALPNGNSTAWTIGKEAGPNDDWHYEIQHIGAQTRFLQNMIKDRNIVTVYLEASGQSWPTWSSNNSGNKYALIYSIVDTIRGIFANYPHEIVMNGHSGGGNFEFNFINGTDTIPDYIKRIAFIDSEYNYSNDLNHGAKIAEWINASPDHYLCVLAYNDSVALYQGEPVVSATGGTWYRSKLMQRKLAEYFSFTYEESDDFLKWTALDGRIQFWLKTNPTQAILHTVQVELNGYIHTILSGTANDNVGYTYYGAHAYDDYIQKLPPETITSMAVLSQNNGKLGLKFNTVEHGDVYRIFWSTDGVNYSNSVDITDSSYVFEDLTGDSLFTFYIQGISKWGQSEASEILVGTIGESTPDVLIINGFDDTETYNYAILHAKSFLKNGKSVISASSEALSAGLVKLSDYSLVDFFSGQDCLTYESVSSSEQLALKGFLQAGGNLLISGGDIFFDLEYRGDSLDQEFCSDFLKSDFISRAPMKKSSTYYQVQFNDKWTDQTGIFSFDNGNYGTYNVRYANTIKPINGSQAGLSFVGVDTSNGIAGVTYSGLFPDGTVPGKTFVTSIPLETIYPDSARAEFIGTVLDFFSSENEIQSAGILTPAKFALEPNYPNPFNGSTHIAFSLPSDSRAKITIYNSLGQVVCTLTDSVYSAGKHEVVWDTKNISTGIYFYRIETPKHSAVRKMILLK